MKKRKIRIKLPSCVHMLDDHLWQGDGVRGRSVEITPLFIERYVGRRSSRSFNAHAFWELTCVLQGEETLLFGDRLLLQPQSVCLIPPRVGHCESSERLVDTIWIGFRGNRAPRGILTTPRVVQSRTLTSLIEQLWLFAEAAFGPAGPELDALTANVVNRFLRLLSEESPEETGDALDRAVKYLVCHHAKTLHMGDVARRFGYSEGYFYRRFKKRTGVAPNVYLTRVRIEHAMRLLRKSSLAVGEVAAKTGFEDPLYFSRVFKRTTGLSPLTFRLRERGAKRLLSVSR